MLVIPLLMVLVDSCAESTLRVLPCSFLPLLLPMLEFSCLPNPSKLLAHSLSPATRCHCRPCLSLTVTPSCETVRQLQVYSSGKGVDINADCHRAGVHNNLFTNIDTGAALPLAAAQAWLACLFLPIALLSAGCCGALPCKPGPRSPRLVLRCRRPGHPCFPQRRREGSRRQQRRQQHVRGTGPGRPELCQVGGVHVHGCSIADRRVQASQLPVNASCAGASGWFLTREGAVLPLLTFPGPSWSPFDRRWWNIHPSDDSITGLPSCSFGPLLNFFGLWGSPGTGRGGRRLLAAAQAQSAVSSGRVRHTSLGAGAVTDRVQAAATADQWQDGGVGSAPEDSGSGDSGSGSRAWATAESWCTREGWWVEQISSGKSVWPPDLHRAQVEARRSGRMR